MRTICKRCAYKDSDCKGDKNQGKGCKYYKKPNVYNAKEAAEKIERLENENIRMAMQLQFISNKYGISYQEWDVIIKAAEIMVNLFTKKRTKETGIPLCNELKRMEEQWEKLK